MRTLRNVVIAALLAAFPVAALGAEYVVVAHPSIRASEVSRGELSRIFLRLSSELPGGDHARPVDQSKSSPIRDAFSRDVLGKSVASLEQYWVQSIFSGRAVPPVEKRGDADVLAYVRDTPGAVGYVSASAPIEGVKKLTVKN